jgi:hypothetical protein
MRVMPYPSNPRPTRFPESPLETLLTALAGWLPVLGGMTLLAMVLITPSWMGWRELLWQRDMLRLQAESLAEQRVTYETFNEALVADDPVLLERLAFTHLRYKPTGKRLLEGVSPENGADVVSVWASEGELVEGRSGLSGTVGGGEIIEHWLASPQPMVGRDIAPLRPINTRLTRLTSGPSRYVLMAVALICLLAGLWPEREETRDEAEIKQATLGPAMTRPEAWGRLRSGPRLASTFRTRP